MSADPLAWDAEAATIAAAVAAGRLGARGRGGHARADRAGRPGDQRLHRPDLRARHGQGTGMSTRARAAGEASRAARRRAVRGQEPVRHRGVVTTRRARRSTAPTRPREADAHLVGKLEAAGAILTGALNMGEYAYDFTGENAHDGVCRNPVDPGPGWPAARPRARRATAAGLAPVSLGSDTNGSIRVPGLVLRHLRPQAHLWPARPVRHLSLLRQPRPSRALRPRVRDLALAYDALQGPDPADHACTTRPPEPVTPPLEPASAGSHCHCRRLVRPVAHGRVRAAVARVAEALGATRSSCSTTPRRPAPPPS
jgi:1-carboxybiuret hydrolase